MQAIDVSEKVRLLGTFLAAYLIESGGFLRRALVHASSAPVFPRVRRDPIVGEALAPVCCRSSRASRNGVGVRRVGWIGGMVGALLALASPVHAQMSLDTLIAEAAKHPLKAPQHITSRRFGTRATTLLEFGFSPSDSETMYLTSSTGFVFATQDSGTSWTEGRLVVRRRSFFGALRPAIAPSGAPFSASNTIRSFQKRGMLRSNIGMAMGFPKGNDPGSSSSFFDYEGSEPVNWGALQDPYFPTAGQSRVQDATGTGGQSGDIARLGVGLKTGAPRLGALLKKKRKRPAGMNLQLLLSTKGVEPTSVSMVAVSPVNPKRALAATSMGLFDTNDGGYSWGNVFPGRNARERNCLFVSYHPTDPEKVFLGTQQGLLISVDGGAKFDRVSGTQLSSASTRWLEFHPSNPDIIYAASGIGAFRTDDGGKNWRWIFFETLPSQNNVRSIALDPLDPDRLTLSTGDGLFRTSDGGRKWERSGAFLFTSQMVNRVLADPLNSNHLFCMTWRAVWETHDWGNTWDAFYINDSEWFPRAIRWDPHDPGVLWILTSHELLRVSPRGSEFVGGGGMERLKAHLAKERSFGQVLDAAFRHLGIHRGELGAKRARARWSALVPRLNGYFGIFDSNPFGELNVNYAPQFGSQVQVLGRNVESDLDVYYGAILRWDLTHLMFHEEEAPFGRYFKVANSSYFGVRSEIQRLYEERVRLLALWYGDPSADPLLRTKRLLRLEELTAHLDALSGGVYAQSLNAILDGTFEKESRP